MLRNEFRFHFICPRRCCSSPFGLFFDFLFTSPFVTSHSQSRHRREEESVCSGLNDSRRAKAASIGLQLSSDGGKEKRVKWEEMGQFVLWSSALSAPEECKWIFMHSLLTLHFAVNVREGRSCWLSFDINFYKHPRVSIATQEWVPKKIELEKFF